MKKKNILHTIPTFNRVMHHSRALPLTLTLSRSLSLCTLVFWFWQLPPSTPVCPPACRWIVMMLQHPSCEEHTAFFNLFRTTLHYLHNAWHRPLHMVRTFWRLWRKSCWQQPVSYFFTCITSCKYALLVGVFCFCCFASSSSVLPLNRLWSANHNV